MNAYVVRDVLFEQGLASAVGLTRSVTTGTAAITDEGHRLFFPNMRADAPFASDGVTVYYRPARAESGEDVQDISEIVRALIIQPLLEAGVPVASWTWERVTDDAITRGETVSASVGYDGPLIRVTIHFAEP